MHGVLAIALLPEAARAEGTAELGVDQALQPETVLKVDLLAANEAIGWSGEVSDPGGGAPVPIDVEVFDATNTSQGLVASGSSTGPLPAGTYRLAVRSPDLDLDGAPDRVPSWDVSVPGATGGRVWSAEWKFEAPDFTEASAFDGSFYAIVDGGSAADRAVVELRTEGAAGRFFYVKANVDGVRNFPNRSVASGALDAHGILAVAEPQFPVYLNPPEAGTFTHLDPVLSNVASTTQCDAVAPGVVNAELGFDASTDGSVHLTCDLDRDGVDPTTDLDVRTEVAAGPGTIRWNGRDRDGTPAAPGVYDCELALEVGEYHFVASDLETAFAGLRLFEVGTGIPAGGRTGLAMHWNDALVQANDVPMPDGATGLERTPPAGLPSGDPADPAVANANARSWGNFTFASKGNLALLDTWTALAESRVALRLEVLDPTLDVDGDGVLDAVERCGDGTDPTLADTDGDGLDDGFEVGVCGSDPNDPDGDDDGVPDGLECDAANPHRNTDGHGRFDWNDPDDDDDAIPTADEDFDGDGDWMDDDVDGDGIPAFRDFDGDGDGYPFEDRNGDGNPLNDDADGDGSPDCNDADDDGDGLPTADERPFDSDGDGDKDRFDPDDDGDGIPTADELGHDTDGDSRPDAFDPDDDNDGVPTVVEGTADSDGDGLVDAHDPDDDGDGIPTAVERGDHDLDGTPDRLDLDSDGDTVPDHAENTVDGAFVPTDTDIDGRLDFVDPDDDGDSLPTADEAGADTDGDGTDDARDPDDDGDGIPTLVELADGTALADAGDADADGLPDRLDLDADGDEVPDATEGRDDDDHDGVPNYLDPFYGPGTTPPPAVPPGTGAYVGGACDQSSGFGSGGATPSGAGRAFPLLLLPLVHRRRRRR